MILSVDPASKTGTALLSSTGEVIDVATFKSPKCANWGKRARYIMTECREYYRDYEEFITHICYEWNHKTSPIVLMIPIVIAAQFPDAFLNKDTGITPSSWKKWWRRESGLNTVSPKGVDDLEVVMPGISSRFEDLDEDSADAIMIGMAFLKYKYPDLKGEHVKL